MVIRVTLDKVLDSRGLSMTELGNRVGITLANLSILKTGKARAVRFSTLDAVCRALDCQPADLLVFETDADVERGDGGDAEDVSVSSADASRRNGAGGTKPVKANTERTQNSAR